MHFVDDIDLEASLAGGETNLIAQVANIFHAGVGSSIDLNQVHEATIIDSDAIHAFVARAVGQVRIEAVDRFGQKARAGGFAGATRPRKEVGVPDALLGDGIFQGLNDVVLTNNLFPETRPPGSVKCLCHRSP